MIYRIKMNDETWLICGGRDFMDYHYLKVIMDNMVSERGFPNTIVHGGATGADRLGEKWAKALTLPVNEYPADWKAYGKAAGPIRNKEMLDKESPDVVIAFPGGKGTEHMIRIAKGRDIEVVQVHDKS